MNLSPSDVELFYKLMLPLQVFVNRNLVVMPDCDTIEKLKDLELIERLKIRDAVYANTNLIDQFVKENPEGFDHQELNIIQSWKRFIAGDFFIERHLARYSIFIKDQDVYAVLGLFDPIEHFAPKELLPSYVKTVLLQFKGVIVYDGMMSTHRIESRTGARDGRQPG